MATNKKKKTTQQAPLYLDVAAGSYLYQSGYTPAQIAALLKPPKTTPPPPPPDASSSTELKFGGGGPYQGSYVYNAPMVKDAYFNPLPNISDDNGVFGHVDLQAYQNARTAWSTTNGKVNAAKGAIQMDRWLWSASNVMQLVTSTNKAKKVSTQMHGFKFLYNPQTVSMTWGQSQYTNNQALLMGLDKIAPAAPGTMNSAINFYVPLNRIQDMNYLQSDGNYHLAKSVGSGNGEIKPTLPYTYDVPIAERKAIYELGTMYDVEWLMKAINGWAFQDHVSDISGRQTSDMGFMLQFPVELHLGNGLRYRVQITDVIVNHVIFNSRMIPIWSTVNITCRRFPEYNFGDISKAVKAGG